MSTNHIAYSVYTSDHKLVETIYGDARKAQRLADKVGGYIVTGTF